MKALILNSGMGTRMGEITKDKPKCMTQLADGETIISRQLTLLKKLGITDVVITTGPYEEKLISYCENLFPDMKFTFVNNNRYKETNYIYSIYLAREYMEDDIILMHGDLVFEIGVFEMLLKNESSCAVISRSVDLPEKDFKALVDGDGHIEKISVNEFKNCYAFQPLYKLNKNDFKVWFKRIAEFCESGNDKCYAENAFNEVSDSCIIKAIDIENMLCFEVDCVEDLEKVRKLL